ncbi:MAG: hypothetical protein NTZ37_01325 [Methanoregula sp.]|nr:hypothetical protein [Methanoregula sp.]
MRDKNIKPSLRKVAYICILITLSLLLITAGCIDSAPKNSPDVPASTCSVDAGVCPVVLPGSVRIEASPQEYSPIMSSTVGIGLTPNVSGLNTTDTQFEWNATYGQFLYWSAPDYTVSRLSQPVVNHGEKIFWSFTEAPASLPVPVIITVTARDVQSQKVLAGSRMTLGWKGNFTVVVEKIE